MLKRVINTYLIWIVILALFNSIFFSCKEQEKELKTNSLTMKIPADWRLDTLPGYEAPVSIFIIKSKDTIYYNFGSDSYSFNEYKFVKPDSLKLWYKSKGFDVSKMIFSEDPETDFAQGIFLDEYYYYDTIDNKRVKISLPKKSGKGLTGIYVKQVVDSLSLSIYGFNLPPEEQNLFLRSIKTIKFDSKK